MSAKQILTNGDLLLDQNLANWIDKMVAYLLENVGESPVVWISTYRRDGASYLAVDFRNQNIFRETGYLKKFFSLTILSSDVLAKMDLELPKSGDRDLSIAVQDGLDSITIAAHLANRLRARIIEFNLFHV